MAVQELSDRAAIQQVILDYAIAVDRHDWALFTGLFTEDARLDYHEIGGLVGPPSAIRDWLANSMPDPRSYYHLQGPSRITLSGSEASSLTACFNPMPGGDGGLRLIGHWYRDRLVRVADGWRISDRRFEACFRTAPRADPPRGR